MSEADKQETSILLPSSRVAVYSKDQKTLEAARNLDNDWRFARVDMQIEEGDIRTAIETYKEIRSPELLIIQTETIKDALTEELEELAVHCEEGTAAIIIGPDNDVALYRKLIDMGISDYLVKPIETKVLADVIAKTLIDKLGVTGSRLIAFVGAKGGVGTTSIVQASAWGVADILGQKTMILDAAGGWSSLSVGVGYEPSTTLGEAAKAAENKDEDSLRRMVHKASERLSVLASGGDVMLESPVTAAHMEELLDMVMAKYPVVLVDLSQSVPEIQKTILGRANEIVVVSTALLPSLRLARSLIQEIKEIRGGEDQDVELILNMVGMDKANEVQKGDIQKAMDLSITSTISFLPKIFMKNESESKRITSTSEGYEIVKTSLLPFIQKLLSVSEDGTSDKAQAKDGFLGNLLGKIKS